MDDWEDEAVPQLLKKDLPKSSWDDEDVDDDEVKESWEDDDEPAPVCSEWQSSPAPAKTSEKPAKKAGSKETGKTGKDVELAKETPLDPVAEKLRQQRLVEEADFKATAELFSRKGDGKTLDSFIPKSESDFLEYAELISYKLCLYEKSYHYVGLLKAVMRLSTGFLKAADAKEVAASVTAIANEKLKAEKEANAGKKKTGLKKKQLLVDKPDDDLAVAGYDDNDDYDFM